MSIRRAASKAVRFVGKATGVGAIADAVMSAHDAAIDKAVTIARKRGASDAIISKALKAYGKARKIQDALAILFPFLPNTAALRALAGKPSPRRDSRSSSVKR